MDQGKRPERKEDAQRRESRRLPEAYTAPEQSPRRTSRQEGQSRSSRKRRGVLSNPLIYLLFVFGLSAVLAALGWTAANDVLALNKPYVKDIIVIEEDDSFKSVVNQLKETGMIEYKFVFNLFSVFAGGEDKIAPGAYWLDTDMDYRAILNALSARSGSRAQTPVTIPEGYTVDQIFKLLEDKGVSTVEKLQEMASTHDYAFSFLQEIPLGDYKRLEGYLFPDTYDFYMGENPRYVLNKMLVNFDAKLTDTLRNQIASSSYSIHDIVIMASLIEKETDGEDRAKISSVIHNRLEKRNSETNGRLDIDASLQYVLPEGELVTQEHYQSLDSPYNTYRNQGLPPGPIANPGMESILAAMKPENTSFFFYALGEDGKHHFSKTYAEHLAFLNR